MAINYNQPVFVSTILITKLNSILHSHKVWITKNWLRSQEKGEYNGKFQTDIQLNAYNKSYYKNENYLQNTLNNNGTELSATYTNN